jgi:hypothetical protein
MTPDQVKELTQELIEAHGTIAEHLKSRPRKAAKDLCEEFRKLLQREDFWNQLTITSRDLERHAPEADKVLGNIVSLIQDESSILARLGTDYSQIGAVISSVYDAVDLVKVRNADTSPQGIKNLQGRLGTATELICAHSRGPLLHALDFVCSKKGAAAIAAFALIAGNVWFAVAADGGVLSHVSIKVGTTIAHAHLEGITALLS